MSKSSNSSVTRSLPCECFIQSARQRFQFSNPVLTNSPFGFSSALLWPWCEPARSNAAAPPPELELELALALAGVGVADADVDTATGVVTIGVPAPEEEEDEGTAAAAAAAAGGARADEPPDLMPPPPPLIPTGLAAIVLSLRFLVGCRSPFASSLVWRCCCAASDCEDDRTDCVATGWGGDAVGGTGGATAAADAGVVRRSTEPCKPGCCTGFES